MYKLLTYKDTYHTFNQKTWSTTIANQKKVGVLEIKSRSRWSRSTTPDGGGGGGDWHRGPIKVIHVLEEKKDRGEIGVLKDLSKSAKVCYMAHLAGCSVQFDALWALYWLNGVQNVHYEFLVVHGPVLFRPTFGGSKEERKLRHSIGVWEFEELERRAWTRHKG
ncbi:hypothetical protein K435DRAFT_805014 [Dendrothele bispora CBS 962.96]|uniref:Uncharacterized protein n=1 Tax=Dendrothele bispora (strain CBS 962.96) TaxID=1314807 RepID=A0A4S8LDU5_DENBC|nr:hypothetical protein K435DRAFT_805014 [Dendrothele bispora CBS 962.96]